MSQLALLLRDSVPTQREPTTILGLLREHMDAVDGATRRRRSFKERFRFIGIGCCGAHWGFRSHGQQPSHQETDPAECLPPTPAASGMNLAAALAAERQLRGEEAVRAAPGTPWRVSLMRLLEETEAGGDKDTVVVAEKKKEEKEGAVGNDWVCCVCMGRKKGAAFIPCGHTFCRVCSRELWLNRGSCPLCNRSIIEILDIF